MSRALATLLCVLAWLALGPARAVMAQDELDDELGPEEGSSEEALASHGESESEDEGESAGEDQGDEHESEDPASSEAPPDTELASKELDEPEPASGTGERAIALYFGAGLGFGTVSFERPTDAGVQALEETPFAAAELLVRVRAWPKQRFSLETSLAYHSSLGLRLQVAPLFALPESVSARVERGELSVAPVLRLGADDGPLAIAIPIGFAFQSLLSETHQYQTPHYFVAGPAVRAELWLDLGEIVSLRAGPELQWLMIMSSSLREQQACCQGFAFGGQCALQAAVSQSVSVALAYRQLHSLVPAPGMMFEDVERFLTARIAGDF